MSNQINEINVNDAVNSYNILSYEEKKKFVERIYGFKLLTVPTLANRLVLISLISTIYKIYKSSHPDTTLPDFMKRLLKDTCLTEEEWFKNFLPFVDALGEGCESNNTFGFKKASEFKDEIMKILNFLLPF